VLAEPPRGWRFPADLTEPNDPRGRVNISELVLWRVAPMVADRGAVLFHMPDDFIWAPPRRPLWPQFAERGIHPRAVISVDPALAPTSSISTPLVLFTREARDQLFVGRLERTVPRSPRWCTTFLRDARTMTLSLVFSPAQRDSGVGDPSCWSMSWVACSGPPSCALADVGRIRGVQLRPDIPYDPPGNCVFVPTLGFGNVLTVPPDLEGRRGYRLLEVQLDPAVARSAIAGAAGPEHDLLDRTEFGLWINLGRTLAKAIRRIKGQPELRPCLGEAAGPAAELMERLAGKRIWEVLDQARRVRNTRAHSGLINPDEEEGWIGSLEVLLSDAEQALASGFDDVDLARADQGRFTSGLHVYPRAERLRGPSNVFEEFELRTRVPLESGRLVLVSRDTAISSVLMLVPLVRVGGTTRATRNAWYFFNSRVDDGRYAYVSYHFEDKPRLKIEEPELRQLELDLSAPFI
jgi:hypothetical protein